MNLLLKQWIKIKITEKTFKSFRIFKISSENKIFIDKKFNALHKQKKLKWTTKSIFYVFLCLWYKTQFNCKTKNHNEKIEWL